MKSKFTLPRRTLLRGMAGGALATIALPPLEAMLNNNGTAFADGSDLPTRFMTWFFGNGAVMDRFEPDPADVGPDWTLSEALLPLAPVKDYITLLTGMNNLVPPSQKITHHEGMVAFTGHPLQDVNGLASRPAGPTIDQVIGDAIQARVRTPVHSVHVGISKRLSVMDGGTTLFALSHRGPNEPQYPEFNPQTIWNQLFGEFVPKPDDGSLRTSILDVVKADIDALRPRLGSSDNMRLDAHLESVNALQQKIESTPPSCSLPEMPSETNTDMGGVEPLTNVNLVMAELIAYAFVCDITRVATVLFSGGAAETRFDEINQTEVHHNNTHNTSQFGQDETHDGVVYIMERFADALGVFADTLDVDGTNLLDSSVIYSSSDCAIGWSHAVERQPVIVAGHGRNCLVHPGIHWQAVAPNAGYGNASGNISDVLLTLAQIFDPGITTIGSGAPSSSTPFEPIKA